MTGDSLPGRIGRYEILQRLGEGATGVVYRARDPEIGRDVAIKVLADRGDRDTEPDRERRRRFLEEVRSAGSLSHPRIVTVHDSGRVEGRHFLVMECLPGGSLQDRLDAGKRGAATAAGC